MPSQVRAEVTAKASGARGLATAEVFREVAPLSHECAKSQVFQPHDEQVNSRAMTPSRHRQFLAQIAEPRRAGTDAIATAVKESKES